MIFVAFIILIIITILVVFRNIYKNKYEFTDYSKDLDVYEEQIDEIESDIRLNLIQKQEAKDTYEEIKEKMDSDKYINKKHETRFPRSLSVLTISLIPILSLMIYFVNGYIFWLDKYDSYFVNGSNISHFDKDQKKMIIGMVESLEKKLIIDDKNIAGWKKLGKSLLVLGDLEKARDSYIKAKNLSPNDLEALEGEANAKLLLEDGRANEEIVLLFRNILRLDPLNLMALIVTAEDDEAIGNNSEAEKKYEIILDKIPKNIKEYNIIKSKLDRLRKN